MSMDMSKKLEEFDFPADLKRMDSRDLSLLAVSIREFLIDKVSETGGHLASNLGAVEISIGLHKVFDSPVDRIIWDVGHQSYVHKILTGRAGHFDTLRQYGGLSGFPKKHESPHDVYETGHSSTSISAALGIAKARDLKQAKGEVIAVIGDGSMTGGPAFEALNNVASSGTKVIIVLNDNGMSIDHNVGGLTDHLGKLRSSRGYQDLKARIKEGVARIPAAGPGLVNAIGNLKDHLKYLLLQGGVLFEELGITYLGPFDGNDIEAVLEGLRQARNVKGPVLVHFITRKGRGYRPAEEDPNRFHGIGAFDPETGVPLAADGPTYSGVFGDAVAELALEHDEVVAVTAAMCEATGLSKMKRLMPERVFDVGIAEGHAVIFACGMASEGLRPVVAIYSSFLQRAYDEIVIDAAMQKLPLIFAIDRAGVVGRDGETHHGIFDLSYLIPIPNMTVFTPCDAVQLRRMLQRAYELGSPCAIRYPRGQAPTKELAYCGPGCANSRLRSGGDVDILAVGSMLPTALAAADILKGNGISAGVVDIACVKPFDPSVIDRDARLVVTVEDNMVLGGFGDSMLGCLRGQELMNLGWPDRFIEQGSQEELLAAYRLDAAGIAERIRERLEKKA